MGRPRFQRHEIVIVISNHPKKRMVIGKIGYVEEVLDAGGGRWRYKVDVHSHHADCDYFYEEELESTGNFD